MTSPTTERRSRRSGPGIHAGQTAAGWAFTLPMIVVLGTFMIVPIGMALYVSFTRWSGTPPCRTWANAPLVGLDNYATLLSGQGLTGRDFMTSVGSPSVAMLVLILLAVWTTTGTFMLMFLAALQDLPEDVDEAAALDGATGWQKLWYVTVPQLRSVLFLVVTLGLIGTWQVFDQVYATGGGSPGKTLLTPAYLSYEQSFKQGRFGTGAAMAFIIFVIIVLLTWVQRRVMTERDEVGR